MMDDTGDDRINFRQFVVGVAPLVHGTLEERLRFAFQVSLCGTVPYRSLSLLQLYDIDGSGGVSREEMIEVFSHMNHAVSYFGDESMSSEKVNEVIEKVFEEFDTDHRGKLDFKQFLSAVAAHPVLIEFVHGSEAAEAPAS